MSPKTDPVNRHYRRLEVIGRGKFGTVYKGLDLATKKLVAIKVLNLDTEQDEVSEVQKEIQFLSQIKSIPNVTHYYGSYLNGHNLWIVMDYCAGGSVRTLLLPGPLEEKFISVIARELLQALQFIHNNGVIHRDIKAANILISKEGRVQLCDFGVAAQLTSTAFKRTTMAGTPYWMAPEVITEGATYNVKADIWSFGITIYEMATGNPPYGDKDAVRALQMIAHHEPPRLEGRQYSSLLKEFVAMCLEEKPDLRPAAGELLHSRFIRAYRQLPTGVLREVIGRYLLWRDRRSSGRRVAEQEAEREKARRQIEEQRERERRPGSEGDDEAAGCDVKWDFDSLKSAEYIVENDIEVGEDPEEGENVESREKDGFDNYTEGYGESYADGSTSSGRQFDSAMSPSTVTPSHLLVPHTKTLAPRPAASTPTSTAPQSLLKLFKEGCGDEDDDGRVNDAVGTIRDEDALIIPPSAGAPGPSTAGSIEIPNMETLEEQGRQMVAGKNREGVRDTRDGRDNSRDVRDTRENMRDNSRDVRDTRENMRDISRDNIRAPSHPRLIARSNTITTSQPSKLQLAAAANGVIPAQESPDFRAARPSPRGSPTHMKPLASAPSQPLLQPINTASANSVGPIAPGPQTAPAVSGSDYFASSGVGPPEKLNQFGVNTSLAANIPLTMTPVSEKPPDHRKTSLSQLQQQPSLAESSKIGHYRHLSTHRTVSGSSQHSQVSQASNLTSQTSTFSAASQMSSASQMSAGSQISTASQISAASQIPFQLSSQFSAHSLASSRAMARLAELHVVDTFDSLLPSSILGEPPDSDSLDSETDTSSDSEPLFPSEDAENMATEVCQMLGKFRDALDMVVEQLS